MAELPVTRDGFNGVTCDLGSIGLEAPDVVAFGARVDSNIERWRADGVRGVWMRVPVGLLELAPALRDRGFSLHHSGDGYLMLTRWLPDPALDPNLLPRYATHFVGPCRRESSSSSLSSSNLTRLAALALTSLSLLSPPRTEPTL